MLCLRAALTQIKEPWIKDLERSIKDFQMQIFIKIKDMSRIVSTEELSGFKNLS